MAVGGGVLWLYYWEEWYSTTAEDVDGGPRVAAVAEFYGREEFLGAMWVLSKVCSGLRHSGDAADKFDGEEGCVEMRRGRRAGFSGVECQAVAIPGVDGA